ncbi:MAG: hypothetical protein CMD96_05700 [Gammaproteobacteria bacterium]|nr:hypothetical protein [Gammaproteobacteria bacterium]
MAKLGINTGSSANDGTGDGLRLGGGKVNANFDEVYSSIGDGSTLRIGTGSTCAITIGESFVGIGSTIPAHLLDVRGGIGATNISISGIATVVDLRGVTAIDATTTATIEAATAGMPNEFEYINVTGMGTIANFRSGISTITTSVEVGTAVTIAPTGINVAGVSTLAGSVTMDSAVVGSAVTIGASGISISGIATVVGLTSPTITATTSTLVGSAVTTDSGGIRVAGVVTATSFIGKYFDGTVIGDVQVGTSLTAYSHGVVTSGIVTAQGGFITGSGTTAVQMSISGNNLLFTVVGIGTTHLVLVP